MKKLTLTLIVIFGILFYSCSREENNLIEPNADKGLIYFGSLLENPQRQNENSKQEIDDLPNCSEEIPGYVEIALSLNDTWVVGSDTNPVRINISPNPGDYDGDGVDNFFTEYSAQLELTPGTYSLEYFKVFDSNDIEIWRAPRQSGNFGDYVDASLPLDITLGAGVKKYVSVDVLCYDNRVVNEYGYLFFDINANEIIEFCVFGNFCNENGRHFSANFMAEVWHYSGNPENPKGEMIAGNLVNNFGVNNSGDPSAEPLCIPLPDSEGLDEYYVEITILDTDTYEANEAIIRSGVITDADVRELFDGDEHTEYFHFMQGGCGQEDSPNLFADANDFIIQVPEGFKIEKLSDGLHLPSSMTWDDEGNMFVAEAGGGLFPQQLAPIRIVQIHPDGSKTEVIDLSNRGIKPSLVGLLWHDGWFYITHRAEDLTGAVSRVSKTGQVELLFKGIIDSQAEHQINDIRIGPDGWMYVSVGPAGNAGVVGPSIAPWVKAKPDLKTRPCQDIVLIGKNFESPNFLTPEEGDLVKTGAFVPFGTETQPGQVIEGVTLCGGSILKFQPENPMGTITTHAWGFRNLIGLTWDSNGNMFGGENGYDNRGSRPVNDELDASLRIHEGMWYGVPDFSAAREPLTDPKFEVPDDLQARVFLNGEFIGKDLGFVIDHQASGLTPPNPSVVLGRHEFNSSPSMLDVAPASWGEWANHVFIAEWGDLAPPTNPLRNGPAGFQVVSVDPANGNLMSFVSNRTGDGPASDLGLRGEGIERPFDVQFGPDGAMYVVDYGKVTIDFSKAPPYAYDSNSGIIWKITKTE